LPIPLQVLALLVAADLVSARRDSVADRAQ
jgi:hypothetical protein